MLKGRLTALLANTRAAITGKGKMAAILANTKAAILADPSKAKAVFRVRVDSIDGVRSTVTAQSSNPLSFDEPAASNLGLGCSIEHGGREIGMVPGEMYLASVGTCITTAIKVFADIVGVEVENASVEVTGIGDLRGLLEIDESVPLGYQEIKYHAKITAKADMEALRTLAIMADSKSPVLESVRGASPVEASFELNGEAFRP
jgi:uncharacterized OsmC-like protein